MGDAQPLTEQTRNLASRSSTRPHIYRDNRVALTNSSTRIRTQTNSTLTLTLISSHTSENVGIGTWPSFEDLPPCPFGAQVKMASVMAGSKRNFATMAAAADWDDANRQPVSRKLSPFLSHIVNPYEPSPPTPGGSPSRGMLCHVMSCHVMPCGFCCRSTALSLFANADEQLLVLLRAPLRTHQISLPPGCSTPMPP